MTSSPLYGVGAAGFSRTCWQDFTRRSAGRLYRAGMASVLSRIGPRRAVGGESKVAAGRVAENQAAGRSSRPYESIVGDGDAPAGR